MTWQDMNFSVDLIDCALKHLDLLETLYKIKSHFKNKKILLKAQYRYEKFWIPFYENHRDTVYPPTDVLLIWFGHMLSPIEYLVDLKKCAKNLGFKDFVLDHTNLSLNEILHRQTYTKPIWENEMGISFSYLESNSVDTLIDSYNSVFSINLLDSVQRQIDFYYQVCFPHFRSKTYLEVAFERYKKFFYLKKNHPACGRMPDNAIELFWYVHKLNPVHYLNDTKHLLEKEMIETNKISVQLWESFYNEDFFLPGSKFKGDPPNETDFFRSQIPLQLFLIQMTKYELINISLKNKSDSPNQERTSFKISLFNETSLLKMPLVEDVLIANEMEFKKISILNDEILKISMDVQHVEHELRYKIKNLLRFGNTHDHRFDKQFHFELKQPRDMQELQVIKYDLVNPRKDELILTLKWRVSLAKNQISLFIIKKDFKSINMMNFKQKFKNFDFDHKNMNAFRACHNVLATTNKFYMFNVEVLHITSLKWSSIRIISKNGSLISSSKLVDMQCLPTNELCSGTFTLNPKYERAMVISNICGDYSLVKGKWIEYNQEKPGRLMITCYFFSNKTTISFAIPDTFIFDFKTENISSLIDLKTGIIKIDLNSAQYIRNEVESLLATVFSIASLHVILQPKKNKKILTKQTSLIENTLKETSFSSIQQSNVRLNPITDEFLLLSAIGYNELINSLSYSLQCTSWLTDAKFDVIFYLF